MARFLTTTDYTYDVSGANTGSYAVYGDSTGGGEQDLILDSGTLTFTTDNAGWYDSNGNHSQGSLVKYDAPEGSITVAEYAFRTVNLGAALTVAFDGVHPSGSKRSTPPVRPAKSMPSVSMPWPTNSRWPGTTPPTS